MFVTRECLSRNKVFPPIHYSQVCSSKDGRKEEAHRREEIQEAHVLRGLTSPLANRARQRLPVAHACTVVLRRRESESYLIVRQGNLLPNVNL